MFRRVGLVSVLVSLLVLAAPVVAQGPITPHHTDPTWQATYWNNVTLSGAHALQRSEADINYDWGVGSPDSSVAVDYFSARWTKYIDVTPGLYRFTAVSDDGIRVWVDGDLIIDAWYEHPARTFQAEKQLTSGHHLVKVEYYEKTGLAVAQVSWMRTDMDIANWRGEYFNNMTISGSPVLVRDDVDLKFNWGTGSPKPGTVDSDHFSVRWTRTANLPAGMYHFSVTTDDGTRLWVNGHLLVDAWYDQAPRTYTGDLYLPGGDVTLEMQYYENGGGAWAELSWTVDGQPTPPPTPPPSTSGVVVDDVDAGFKRGGPWSGWGTATEGYNDNLTWTRNSSSVQQDYNWARWYPNLTPGSYEVYVYIPDRYTTTSQARYWVYHAGGYVLRLVNQSTNGDRWVSLGTYQFRGDGTEFVSLADVTYEAHRTTLVAFDAVKWVAR